tara:strand:+ start:581 stop:1501 length:921 start_codon:yes stop_codon:yes gene_type:complete
MASLSCLQLLGTLSVPLGGQYAPPNVDQTMVTDISAALVEHGRLINSGLESVTYYILADFDINSVISYTPSSSVDGVDDAYSMASITVPLQGYIGTTPVLNLPAISSQVIDAGNINAANHDGTHLQDFPVKLTVSVNSAGLMTSEIVVTGNNAEATETEDPKKAQVVYWPVITSPAPIVTAATADILTSAITADQLALQYSAELALIRADYNDKNMITDWTISFDPVLPATDNTLSQHARSLNKTQSDPLFNEGDKIVCATEYLYSVSFKDYQDIQKTFFDSEKVYGVLQQTATGASTPPFLVPPS